MDLIITSKELSTLLNAIRHVLTFRSELSFVEKSPTIIIKETKSVYGVTFVVEAIYWKRYDSVISIEEDGLYYTNGMGSHRLIHKYKSIADFVKEYSVAQQY